MGLALSHLMFGYTWYSYSLHQVLVMRLLDVLGVFPPPSGRGLERMVADKVRPLLIG